MVCNVAIFKQVRRNPGIHRSRHNAYSPSALASGGFLNMKPAALNVTHVQEREVSEVVHASDLVLDMH